MSEPLFLGSGEAFPDKIYARTHKLSAGKITPPQSPIFPQQASVVYSIEKRCKSIAGFGMIMIYRDNY